MLLFSMVQFIISQIFGGIALILVCISYFLSKNKFLFFQIVANLFYGAAFLVSLSLVAGINTIISILRCLLILYYEKQNKDFPIYFNMAYNPFSIDIAAPCEARLNSAERYCQQRDLVYQRYFINV